MDTRRYTQTLALFASLLLVVVSAGVQINSCSYRKDTTTITNTNNYPVIIRQVWQFSGDETQAVYSLGAGNSKEVNRFSADQTGFLIYRQGELIGFVKCERGR